MKKTTKKTTKVTKPKEKDDTSDMYYTKEEIKELDKYHEKTEHKFEDEEIYEIMQKYKGEEVKITEELEKMLADRKRGGDTEWNVVGKSNSKNFLLFIYN